MFGKPDEGDYESSRKIQACRFPTISATFCIEGHWPDQSHGGGAMNQESDSPETGSKSTCDPSKDDMRFGCGLMAGVVLCVGGSILCLVEMYVYDLLDFNRLLPLMGILTIVFLVPWIKIIYLAPASTKLGRRGFKVLGSSVAAAFGSMIT